jgi:hypothetical protein
LRLDSVGSGEGCLRRVAIGFNRECTRRVLTSHVVLAKRLLYVLTQLVQMRAYLALGEDEKTLAANGTTDIAANIGRYALNGHSQAPKFEKYSPESE